ncbi:hypothetical protein HanXRQr2_Chr11g0496601 [Helianthus annuus]|uniref:Uncharacterized protein n=1 Tax=Helianthus annuus TaxID=4232 RepID=A0A9K3HPW0_HELAN|nr:hypothetical protein HanXRQr2_Chr11g0496601 [Helianthus annuus]KAJ0875630.1 hypothetical protein HanPSC8_Chr11g0478641 [Helianthus annuus]
MEEKRSSDARYLWKPEDDQAQRRTEHDTVTCFRTSPRCKF